MPTPDTILSTTLQGRSPAFYSNLQQQAFCGMWARYGKLTASLYIMHVLY